MKAYHILLFLMIFNLFFWVIASEDGLNLFNVGVSGQEQYGDLMQDSDQNTTGFAIFGAFGLFGDGFLDLVALSGVLAGAAMLGYFSAGTAPQGVIYALFSWVFWSSYLNTMTLFFNLANSSREVMFIIVLFSVIVGVVFTAGLAQMVTGGWKAHE